MSDEMENPRAGGSPGVSNHQERESTGNTSILTPAAAQSPAPRGYASAFRAYRTAGWENVLPLSPGKKSPPPTGYTGREAKTPSYPDLYSWAEEFPDGNVCLRLPANVIGIDVDHYDGKDGGGTLQRHIDQFGPLPATWRTGSRTDGTSGIRLFRVPKGLQWPGDLGGGIEIIQSRHRYAIVAPSRHPNGGTYRWSHDVLPSPTDFVPGPEDLAELPEAWVAGLTGGLTAKNIQAADLAHPEAVAWLKDHGQGTACRQVEQAVNAYINELSTSARSRHEVGKDATMRLARMAAEGHGGTYEALTQVRAAFLQALDGDPRATEGPEEFNRLLLGAVRIAAVDVVGGPDPCQNPYHGLLTAEDYEASWQPHPPASTTRTEAEALLPLTSEPARPVIAPVTDWGFVDGGSFVFDIPAMTPAVWGTGGEVLWAEGEALMICGPSGVGKTTLTGQLVRALLGLSTDVLGYPVNNYGKVLYLAMDRPAQVRRSLHRLFQPAERPVVEAGLTVLQGPPAGDMAKNPSLLKRMSEAAGAGVVILDSLKDAAIGLSDDAVGAGYNSARQMALAAGVQVLELHHQTKRGTGGSDKPNTLADVYGSTWITGGAGSVVLLWGAAGDPVVEFRHLKQPAETVGPFRVMHDHAAGVSTVYGSVDPLALVRAKPDGITAREFAAALVENGAPSRAEVEKARRKLTRLVKAGQLATREIPAFNGANASQVFVLPTAAVHEGSTEALFQ